MRDIPNLTDDPPKSQEYLTPLPQESDLGHILEKKIYSVVGFPLGVALPSPGQPGPLDGSQAVQPKPRKPGQGDSSSRSSLFQKVIRGWLLGPHTPRQLPAFGYRKEKSSERPTVCWREQDSNLYGAFPVKPYFWFVVGSLFRSGKAVLVPSLRSGSWSAQKGVKGPKR